MEIADQLRNTKIWIGDNPDIARHVQETLFGYGAKWNSNDTEVRSNISCLFIHEDLTITMSPIDDGIDYTRDYYYNQDLKEITPEKLFELSTEESKNQNKDMSWVVKAEDNYLLKAFSEMLGEKGLYPEAVTFLNTGRDVLSNTYGNLEQFTAYQDSIEEDRSHKFHLPEDWEVAKKHILEAASVKKQPELRVEGYNAEFREGSIKVGCVEVPSTFIRDLRNLMQTSGKEISLKVGTSEVSSTKIMEISEYYLDKIRY